MKLRNLRLRSATLILLALAPGFVLTAGTPSARADPAGQQTACGVLTSIHWNSKTGGRTLSGTRYTVAARGFSCALAVKLVPGLIKQKGTPFGRTLNGPEGYTCIADVGGNNPHAIAGVCHRAGGKSFVWGPKVS